MIGILLFANSNSPLSIFPLNLIYETQSITPINTYFLYFFQRQDLRVDRFISLFPLKMAFWRKVQLRSYAIQISSYTRGQQSYFMGCVGGKPKYDGGAAGGELVNEASNVRRESQRKLIEEDASGGKVLGQNLEGKSGIKNEKPEGVDPNKQPKVEQGGSKSKSKIEPGKPGSNLPNKQPEPALKERVKIEIVNQVNKQPEKEGVNPENARQPAQESRQSGDTAKFIQQDSKLRGGKEYLPQDAMMGTPSQKQRELRQFFQDLSSSQLKKMNQGSKLKYSNGAVGLKEQQNTSILKSGKQENPKNDGEVGKQVKESKINGSSALRNGSKINDKNSIRGGEKQKVEDFIIENKEGEIKQSAKNGGGPSNLKVDPKTSNLRVNERSHREDASIFHTELSEHNYNPSGQYIIGKGEENIQSRQSMGKSYTSNQPYEAQAGQSLSSNKPANSPFSKQPSQNPSFIRDPKNPSSIRGSVTNSQGGQPREPLPNISGIRPVPREWGGDVEGFYNPFADPTNTSKLMPISYIGQVPNDPIDPIESSGFSFQSFLRA